LDKVQCGREPTDWKPMSSIGEGVKEIRLQDEAGAFRVIYLAKLVDAIHVLHCFHKKTQQTSDKDIELARKRFEDLMKAVMSKEQRFASVWDAIEDTAGTNIPLVVQTGKWRRQVTIPNVASCTNTPLPVSLTRLPKNRNEGDIPRIAVVTGSPDMPECILRKIGIDDAEFTQPFESGRINLIKGDTGGGAAVDQSLVPIESNVVANLAVLSLYDSMIFACQGSPTPPTQQAKDNIVAYANAGGRVFAADLEYRWLYNEAPFSSTALWSIEQPDPAPQTVSINTSFPGGLRLAHWMEAVNGSSRSGRFRSRLDWCCTRTRTVWLRPRSRGSRSATRRP